MPGGKAKNRVKTRNLPEKNENLCKRDRANLKEGKMAQGHGFVTSVREDGWAQVVTERKDACENCGASHCCVSFGTKSEMLAMALNKAGAKEGDYVSLILRSGILLKAAAVMYLIPVIGLVLGAAMGSGLNTGLPISETTSVIVFGFAGLFLGFIITALMSKWMSGNSNLTPVISRIINQGVQDTHEVTVIDPVCKMTVNLAEKPESFSYKNKDYYFCSQNCRESFIKDPERYL